MFFMYREIIEERTKEQVQQWQNLQNRLGEPPIRVTEKAVDLISLIISNIDDDPSLFWNKERGAMDDLQQKAISLVPNVLNEVLYGSNTLRRIRRRNIEEISTWEILHSMTRILDSWCFISKSI